MALPNLLSQRAVWYVDSGATGSANGKTWKDAVTTIDAAINLASDGDLILVAPSHAEDLGSAGAINLDVAGVMVVGLGSGRTRPMLTVTNTAGSLRMTAARTSITNLQFVGGIDASTGCIRVEASDCSIVNCGYRDSTGEATDVIVTTAAADRLLIDQFVAIMSSSAGPNSAIALVGADDCEVRNFYLVGNFAVSAIDLRTTASPRVWIHDGMIWTQNSADLCIKDTVTGSTGTIGPNIGCRLQDNAANITEAVTGATFHMIDPVYVVNAVNEKAMLINWIASTDA